MKKINLLNLRQQVHKNCLWIMLSFFALAQGAQGQCVLSVSELTNLSLDQDCMGIVTPEMVGTTTGCPGGSFKIVLEDEYGNTLPGDVVTGDYIGQTLTVSIVDMVSGNSSWGYLFVEDKLAPVMECPTITGPIYCYNLNQYAPTVTDNCGDYRLIMTNLATITNPCNDTTFTDDVLRRVTRSFIAVDESGRYSEECIIEIDVLRVPSFDVITPPDHLMIQTSTNLKCDGDYHLDENGHPAPYDTIIAGVPSGGTGVLMFDSIALFPTQDTLCNILVDYDDRVLPRIGCVTKIMRTWTVLEWSCAQAQRDTSFLQIIEISDDEGPTFVCPSDLTVSTNAHGCEATVLLPSIVAKDNCSDVITYNISWDHGFLNTNGGLANFPVGMTEVTYTAFDDCHNPSETCVIKVVVSDMTPPVTICDLHTTVSLTNMGIAKVKAEVFDDGSYDECDFDKVLVRRMDTTCDGYEEEDGDDEDTPYFDNLWFEYIHFCCEDLGTPVMVVLRAYDHAGNYNDCMVEVHIQDKIAPRITCPDDMTVDCDFPYDTEDLGSFFGDAVVTTSCEGATPDERLREELNQCNVGFIERTFTATNGGGTATCTQTIYFQPIERFNYTEEDIFWPRDTLITGCLDPSGAGFEPEDIGFPTYNDGSCALVGASWEDKVFPFNNSFGDACFKIIRKWTVIDWCQFHTDGYGYTHYPEWTWTQIIKVNDPIDPVITSSCERVSICTYDLDCADGVIELEAEATDNCTTDLKWSYKVDLNNNGTFENLVWLRGYGVGNTAVATRAYPVGNHRIVWTFEDKCGNIDACEQLFDIMSCKTPTPYCINGLAISLMPVDEDNDGTTDFGMVEMWASDFDAGSFHPCYNNVYLSFEPATELDEYGHPIIAPNRTFTCDDIGEVDVMIYAIVVTSMGEIIQDFCNTFVDVQDNTNACSDDDLRVTITGEISTSMDEVLQNVTVELDGADIEDQMTNIEGAYAFPSMPLGGSYIVSPTKDDDYRNGVNTMDLVLIQRHILGLEIIESPYKLLAADVNSDEAIKPSDLLTLRKLILGVTNEFAESGSWKFIDAAYTFADATNPFAEPFPQTYEINSLGSDMNIDFIAVKMGDVNEDANVTGEEDIEGRSSRSFGMEVANIEFTKGTTVRLPIVSTNDASMVGAQFTIGFDNELLEVVGIESEMITVDQNNLGFAYADQGNVTFSWNDVNAVNFEEGQVIATLVLVAKGSSDIAKSINVNSSITNAEAYTSGLDRMDIDFIIDGRSSNETFNVYQNKPNPFSDLTTVTFDLPTASDVKFVIYELTGKVISTSTKSYEAGTHNIEVNKDDINGSGIYYYQIKAGKYSATKKMVVIE